MGKKSFAAILLCVSLLLALTGCNAAKSETVPDQPEKIETPVADDSIYITLYIANPATEEGSKEGTTESGVDPAASAVEESELATSVVVAAIDKDALSVERIVAEYNQMVIQSLYGTTLTVNAVRQEQDKAWVDLDSASVNALDIADGDEGTLFYNLARSIDVNMSDIDHIYLTMDGGKDFQLGHLWFEASRPFYSSIMPLEGDEGNTSGDSVVPE